MTTIESNVDRILMPVGPWLHDLLVGQNQLLVEVLTELRHLRAAQGATAENASSVKLTTSTRGVDIAVHAYVGSPVIEAESEAVKSYLRIRAELEQRIMEGVKATVEGK